MSLPQPYRNAELYRGYPAVGKFTHADFMAIAPDDTTVIGRSDLTGRIWNGIVRVFEKPDDLIPNIDTKLSYPDIVLSNGVTDGCFVGDSTKLLISDDVGELSLWNKSPTWSGAGKGGDQDDPWSLNATICEHDDAVLAVDVFHGNDMIVSGGADNCIKVWDPSFTSLETFRPAHTHIVTDLMCNKESDSFLSCSLDGTIVLWDIKCIDSKIRVLANVDCAVRTVCWISGTKFLAGFDNGDVRLYDISQPDIVLAKTNIRCPIHRIIYNEKSNLLAVCSDSNKIRVFKLTGSSDFELVYEDTRHTEYIRGLSWGNGESVVLYTCGWDTKVYKHSILF